ncbi:MAG: hypothetical protein HQ536_01610 [Parcubacteria group bacterium]|nr:hypothetical protein [Parcubacteria group bacterium]
MSINYKDDIETFFTYIEEALKAIKKINTPDKSNTRVFKKILYCTIVDTLSKCAHPQKTDNGKRFRDFVSEFGNWDERNKVSLPQLKLYLDKQSNECFNFLKNFVEQKINQWEEALICETKNLEHDPTLKEIIKFCSNRKKQEELKFFQHISLLWKYRNFLIHEFREPEGSFEGENDYEIHYYSQTDLNTQEETWELVYPLSFFEKLAETCTNNLKKKFLVEKTSPYDSFAFSSEWFLDNKAKKKHNKTKSLRGA